jgi:hypothetical protein
MKLSANKTLKFIPLFLLCIASCTQELNHSNIIDEVKITATASLSGGYTKMIYEDLERKNIKSGWETGDKFLALEINGSTVTPVTFTATATEGVKASFQSSGAKQADANTKWVAVLGKKAAFKGDGISLSYSGQDGSLQGLEGFDYIVATSTGIEPDFNYANGNHLTYLLRIKMPEGIGKLEFNTCAEDAEWTISSEGTAAPCEIDWRPRAVKLLNLKQETRADEDVYLAVPALDYSEAGLIVTIMNNAGTKSQGKVKSENFSAKGGRVGTFDLTLQPLMDRPTAADAIDFLSVNKSQLHFINNTSYSGIPDRYNFANSPKWAPFNVGASANPQSAEDYYGNYYAWGETEQRDSYAAESYKYADNQESIGITRTYRGDADVPINMQVISGTKYDVARVKWGREWRMPLLQELFGFTGDNEILDVIQGRKTTTNTSFKTKDVSEYNGVAVNGRTFWRNGKTLFLPFAGRYYYTASAPATQVSLLGRAGCYFCGTHNNIPGSGEAYRLYVRNTQIEYMSQPSGFGFSVRAVLAQDTDEPAPPVTVSGIIKDAGTDKGIAGVVVSDGYTCSKTNSRGEYTLEANVLARTINVSIPSTHKIPIGPDGRPAFYKEVDLSGKSELTVDFSLTPRSNPSSRFTIIAVADAHIQNESHVEMFRTTGIEDIKGTITELESSGEAGEIIGITLGDQLWDNMDISASARAQFTSLRTSAGTMPFFYCIGNHDHQTGCGDSDYLSTESFVRNFGPTDYSFNIGNAHIIVMDDVYNTGKDGMGGSPYPSIGYRSIITGEQYHWLKQDLDNVDNKENKVVIFCTHIPIYQSIGNGEAIKSLLCKFNEAYIFSGHIHNMTKDFHKGFKAKSGRTLIEYNMQSLCGMWWLANLSPNGTPMGYGVFTFDGPGMYSEYNKVVGASKDFQMRVYRGDDAYSSRYYWDNEYKGKFLVRIWNGDDPDINTGEFHWEVSFVQNGVSKPMTRLSSAIVDKCSAAYIVHTLNSPYGTGGSATSYSWWMIDAPSGDAANESDWQIVAKHTLPGGWQATYSTSHLTRDFTGYGLGSNYIY